MNKHSPSNRLHFYLKQKRRQGFGELLWWPSLAKYTQGPVEMGHVGDISHRHNTLVHKQRALKAHTTENIYHDKLEEKHANDISFQFDFPTPSSPTVLIQTTCDVVAAFCLYSLS